MRNDLQMTQEWRWRKSEPLLDEDGYNYMTQESADATQTPPPGTLRMLKKI